METKLETYEFNFDLFKNVTKKIEARDENEAIEKLEKLLDDKNIERQRISNFRIKRLKK